MRTKVLHFAFIYAFCFIAGIVSAQQTIYSPTAFSSSGDIFGTRNFVENKGAYHHPLRSNEEVEFVYECAGEKIY